MKKIIALLLLIVSFGADAEIEKISRAESNLCGLDNLQTQQDILTAEDCLIKLINNLSQAIDNYIPIAIEMKNKYKSLIKEESLCNKFQEYYNNATGNEKEMLKANVHDCKIAYKQRLKDFSEFNPDYVDAKNEVKKAKFIRSVLSGKLDILKNSAEILIENNRNQY